MPHADPSLPGYLLMQKQTLRRTMKLRRRSAWLQRPDAGLALRDHFLRAFTLPKACVVAAYSPRRDEIDPMPLALELFVAGHTLVLPCVVGRDKPLSFRVWNPGHELVRGSFGIWEPKPDAPVSDPDVLLVPLLAFDKTGNRIGYGGGFYDRTLQALRARRKIIAIGLAFAAQEESSLPVSEEDFSLDGVVTELGVR